MIARAPILPRHDVDHIRRAGVTGVMLEPLRLITTHDVSGGIPVHSTGAPAMPR